MEANLKSVTNRLPDVALFYAGRCTAMPIAPASSLFHQAYRLHQWLIDQTATIPRNQDDPADKLLYRCFASSTRYMTAITLEHHQTP